KLLTIVGGLIGLLIIVFLAFRFFTPFGAVVKYQFNSILNRDKLSKLKGAEETSSFKPGENGVLQIPQQIIRQSVVTFNLKLITKPIEGVWVNLRFKGNSKEIKIGVRGSEKEKYQYLPLYNQILNPLEWSKTYEGKTTFWQREKKYQDLSGLVSQPPVSEDAKVASYFFNPSDIVMKENSPSSQSNLKIEKTLRGSHTLLVKVNKGPFLLTVIKQDINTYEGEDVLSVQIYNGQNKIAEQLIPDDGVTDAGRLAMAPQKSEIKINDIKPGIYKIVLQDMTKNADILIKSVEINQPSLVFQTPLFVDDGKPTTLWTNSKEITMITAHSSSIQTVKLDGKYDLKVEKDGKEFAFDLNNPDSKIATSSGANASTLHRLEIPKNDLIISGDGYFAFSQESFFNPEPIKAVDLSQVSDINKIDFIIANYQTVKKDGEWYTAQAYFDPFGITIDDDILYFSLESPELNSYGGEIVIDSLEVTVKKPGWFSKPEPAKESVSADDQKQNILQKAQEWLGAKWNQLTNWVSNAWQKVFKKTPDTITITNPSLSPSPSPSPMQKITNFIRILNGGAGQGGAGEFAKVLAAAGFTNVTAETADNTDYKNAIIKYRQEDEKVVAKLEELLKKDYQIIDKQKIATTSAGIVVIIGEK
ncbi:LytR C-terminal domain-containing protein, partial [Patescibacteria group bacterium]|nr:LytR C-terminal domain-containing protein [Patescibacteria group bacterium]